MLAAVLLTLATVVLEAPPPQKVLVLDLEPTGVAIDDARALDRLLLAELSRVAAVEVVSAGELRRLVELEAEKQAIGCDDAGCLAELAGALGARFVVFGTISAIGDRTTLVLSIYDEASGTIQRDAATARSAAALAPLLRPAVARLLGKVGVDAPYVAEPPPGPGPLLYAGGAAVGVGALGAVLAAVIVVASELEVQTPARDGHEKARAQVVGRIGLIGLGAAVLVATGGGVALVLGLVE